MNISIINHDRKPPTFSDVPVSHLFIWECRVFVKVNTTQAMQIGKQLDRFAPCVHDTVALVTSLTVSAAR